MRGRDQATHVPEGPGHKSPGREELAKCVPLAGTRQDCRQLLGIERRRFGEGALHGILLTDHKLHVFVLPQRTGPEDVEDEIVAVREHDVASIVQLQYDVVGRLARAELHVDNAVGAQLLESLDALVLEMLAQLHGEPRRSLVLGPRELGRVQPHAGLDEQHGLLFLSAQFEEVRLGVDVVHLHDAHADDALLQLGDHREDVDGAEAALHGARSLENDGRC